MLFIFYKNHISIISYMKRIKGVNNSSPAFGVNKKKESKNVLLFRGRKKG